MSKARNVNLSGATWNVNVSYWMLFRSGGYGMHDAPWRSSSQINSRSTYLKNGSHGCVNMKRSDAAGLYSKVRTGTTVIVCK
jgi:lipoprotein-anchoring transpeptidase ErfK/SrfK